MVNLLFSFHDSLASHSFLLLCIVLSRCCKMSIFPWNQSSIRLSIYVSIDRHRSAEGVVTCGGGLTLFCLIIEVLAAWTRAEEGAFTVHTLRFSTHTTEQLALIHI